jgi:hypothetical protein
MKSVRVMLDFNIQGMKRIYRAPRRAHAELFERKASFLNVSNKHH